METRGEETTKFHWSDQQASSALKYHQFLTRKAGSSSWFIQFTRESQLSNFPKQTRRRNGKANEGETKHRNWQKTKHSFSAPKKAKKSNKQPKSTAHRTGAYKISNTTLKTVVVMNTTAKTHEQHSKKTKD